MNEQDAKQNTKHTYPHREFVYNRLRKLNLSYISVLNPYRTMYMGTMMLVVWQDLLTYLPYPYNAHYISKALYHKYVITKHSTRFLDIEVYLKNDEWVIERNEDKDNLIPYTGENLIHILENYLLKVIENESV